MSDLFQCTCPTCGQTLPERQQESTFAAFWKLVPHKVNKAQAEKTWRRMTAPDRAAATDNVQRFYAKFRADYPTASPLHPSTYLSGKRWQDLEPDKGVSIDAKRAFYEARLSSPVDGVRRAAQEALARLDKNRLQV